MAVTMPLKTGACEGPRLISCRNGGMRLAQSLRRRDREMKIIDRERDAISLEPDLDRTAFWLTIHGATRKENRVVRLSVLEAKLLADALLFHAEDVEVNHRDDRGPIDGE
jgi:hypothetical protein